jgi:hypothetical protein
MSPHEVTIRVDEAHIDLSIDRSAWRARYENVIVLRPNDYGRGSTAVAIGEQALGQRPPDALVMPVFDATGFDAGVAGVATRWFVWQALGGVGGSFLKWFRRPSIELSWPAWPNVRKDERDGYLLEVAVFADLHVSGGPTVRQTRLRRLFRRPPDILV